MTLRTLFDRFDLLMDTPESVPKLRRFILQSAVQGSLTRRDQDDTPADVLLEQIQQEKQRLYDAGKIRKPSTFEPVPESGQPHDIPSEWKWVRLGKVGNTQTGQTPKKSEDRFYGGKYPFLKPDNIENGEATYQGETLTEAGVQDGRVVPEGSVLMVCIGTVGKAAVVNRKCSCNQQINYITPYGSLSSKYTLRAMQSTSFQKEAYQKSRSTTITILNKGNWETIPFPLPPPEEQQRIVKAVDGLMDECDALEEQQEREHALQVQVGTSATEALQSADDAEALRPAWERVREHFDTVTATPEGVDALRQTILQLAVQGRFTERNTEDKPASELVRKSSVEIQELYDSGKITKPSERPPVREEEKVFNLPDKWTWTRLGNVLALVNGRAYKKSELLDEGTPVIRIQNLTGGGSWYYTDLDLPPEKYCNTGDLLYTWSGTFGPHIWNGGKAVFHYHIWRIELTTGLTKQFAYHLLQAISADVEEDAHGIMLPHMTKGGMEKHPVPLPPLAEQKRIVETLDRLLPLFDRLSENVNQKSKRGEQLLKAALERASADQQDTVATGMAA